MLYSDWTTSETRSKNKEWIEDNPLLEWFRLERTTVNKEPSETGEIDPINVISKEWDIIPPLEIDSKTTPVDTDNDYLNYKKGKVSLETLIWTLEKYENYKKNLNKTIDDSWYEWIKWINWWKRINMLAPKSLGLDTEKDYYTDLELSLDKDSVSYLWKFWDKSLFISTWTNVSDMPLSNMLPDNWACIVAISEKWEIYTANVLWFNILKFAWPTEDFNIHEYQWNLLLSQSKKYLEGWHKDYLKVLVDNEWVLSEKLFSWWEISISETQDQVKRNKESVHKISQMAYDSLLNDDES